MSLVALSDNEILQFILITGAASPPPPPPPPKIGKNMILWRKIVIFHTKYLKDFRASLRSAQFFKCAPPPP